MQSAYQYRYILLANLFLLTLFACKNKKQATSLNVVSSYIYAYTSGAVSKSTPIRTRFIREAISADEVGTVVDNSIFKINPSIAGSAVWEDTRTILFKPEGTFTSDENYQVTVALQKLFSDAKGKTSEFIFNFRTKPLRFDLLVEGLKEVNKKLKSQELIGTINTSDLVPTELIEQSLNAQQDGRDLPITWIDLESGAKHRFIIKEIRREEKASEVVLNWNASPLNIKEKGSKTIAVPAIHDFKVLTVSTSAEGDPHILINFSDPILKTQELKGLVSIKDYTKGLKYIVEGNDLRIYPSEKITGNHTILIGEGIKNKTGGRLTKRSTFNISIADIEPAVRLVGNGTIIPTSDGLLFPFEAVSLNAIDVEIFKIYNDNILQFLQTNELDGDRNLARVGKIYLQKKILLTELDPTSNSRTWTRYAFDLKPLIDSDNDPNAIYQVRIGFRKAYTTYTCEDKATTSNDLSLVENPFDKQATPKSILDSYYGIDGDRRNYNWQQRKKPCHHAYYNSSRFKKRMVIASDLGIIAKRGKDNKVLVAVADIKTTQQKVGVQLDFYNYQQRLISTATTDSEGIAKIDLEETPFVVVATKKNQTTDDQKGYLKMMDGSALSLSRFNVSGARPQKGLKGFIYAERGVWRPGDSIFLNFILEDKTQKLPANHPIAVELINPKGQVTQQWTSSKNVNNIYSMATSTSTDAPTGNWVANVSVGGAKFSKRLKIETVKPNRLKIKLDFGDAETLQVQEEQVSGNLQVNWLHGAPAQNVKARIEAQVTAINTTFDKYKEYEFDDPARKYNPEPMVIFEDQVDSDGIAAIKAKLTSKNVAPGKLRCNFQTKAFEKGGDFSTNNFSMPYSPYNVYTGVFLKKNKYGEKRLKINRDGDIEFIAVDEKGEALRSRNLKVGLYKVDWRWWWDSGRDNIAKYNSAQHYGAIDTGSLRTNSKGTATWSVKVPEWGRYLVRVCDVESGHCSGDFFYAGSPWYEDEDDGGQNRKAAAMLRFAADKDKYQVGESVELTIPSSEDGRALISIESGNRILETYWTDTQAGETKFSFYATKEMTPTIYANVSLLQPHAQIKNDLPIRLYGVVPINVEDKNTRLEPLLDMPKTLEPQQTITIKVSEKSNKPMAYTIAMVDEGLLDLTQFKTPTPWNTFYAREALGVKTWDVYDYILGAHGTQLDRILAIGGDGALAATKQPDKANRFKAVVRHLGPFYLERGTATHQITLPNYVGSVRTMIVAANKGAYGESETTTPVKKPLMTLATLPRVLSPTEKLTLPVTVFAMEDKIKNVQVKVTETSGIVDIVGESSKNITFEKPGETVVNFDLAVKQSIGIAKFKVEVSGGGEVATHEIELAIDNPNPYVNSLKEKVLQPGEVWNTTYEAIGMQGTNTGILEIANIPPIDIGNRLNYLLRYPHGCVEQVTSAAFPQLYVNKLMELDQKMQDRSTENIKAGIEQIKKFQLASGAFSYWPGNTHKSDWGTSYAGHFLLEAKALGYTIPPNLLDNWKRYQKKQANSWTRSTSYNDDIRQAYRLYTLAVANAPEMGAMNRLRETAKLKNQAKWRLAAAYAQTGRFEVAEALVKELSTTVKPYKELSYSYGSGLRDEAMILETLVLMKDYEQAGRVVKNMSKQLNSGSWFSTQTVAYSLLAVGKLVGNTAIGKPYNFNYQVGNLAAQDAGSDKPIMNIDIPVDGHNNKTLKVTNNSDGILYATIIVNGQPLMGEETSDEEDLNMSVQFVDLKGETINTTQIPQGTDFAAKVTISNPGNRGINYEEMALTQIFPSGWEILNTRMSNLDYFKDANTPEYLDVKDDRVYAYFDINKKKTHTYMVQLNAAYQGTYYLPAITCEAMYDNTIYARSEGQWVKVVAPREL